MLSLSSFASSSASSSTLVVLVCFGFLHRRDEGRRESDCKSSVNHVHHKWLEVDEAVAHLRPIVSNFALIAETLKLVVHSKSKFCGEVLALGQTTVSE